VVVALVDGDVAGGEAHPQDEGQLGLAGGVGVGRLLDGHGRRHRLGGSGEAGQHAVAQPLHHHAAVGLDGAAQQPVVEAAQPLGLLLAQARP
jgi:hypothetical protein